MLQGVRNVIDWEIPIEHAIQMSQQTPPESTLSKIGMLIPGNIADILVLDKNLQMKGLFIDGNLIRDRFS